MSNVDELLKDSDLDLTQPSNHFIYGENNLS